MDNTDNSKEQPIRLPANTRIGKQYLNSIMTGGRPVSCDSAQIFVRCVKCGDTIAILPIGPDRNAIVDGISNAKATKIFRAYGWTVFGDSKKESTMCPECVKNNNHEPN